MDAAHADVGGIGLFVEQGLPVMEVVAPALLPHRTQLLGFETPCPVQRFPVFRDVADGQFSPAPARQRRIFRILRKLHLPRPAPPLTARTTTRRVARRAVTVRLFGEGRGRWKNAFGGCHRARHRREYPSRSAATAFGPLSGTTSPL